MIFLWKFEEIVYFWFPVVLLRNPISFPQLILLYITLSSSFPSNSWESFKIYLSLVAQRVKHLPAMRETRARSLGWEDPLEKEIAPHSSTHAWKIPWTKEPGRLQFMGLWRVRHNWVASLYYLSSKFWHSVIMYNDMKFLVHFT